MRIEKTNTLAKELECALRALEAVSKDEGQRQAAYLNGELNFDPALPYIYLAYDDENALAGFICAFMPTAQAEIYAYTRPDARKRGVFTALIKQAQGDLRAAGVWRMLFQIEKCASTANAVLKKMYPEAKLDRTEYTMQRERGDVPTGNAPTCGVPTGNAPTCGVPVHELESGFSYARVTRDDLKAFCDLTNAAFNDYEDDESSPMNTSLCESDERAAYMALDGDGVPAGAVCLCFENEGEVRQAFIYGLCVREDVRSRGLGRALLSKALEVSFNGAGVTRAKLDVETTNPNALGLYKSCGFEEACTVEYWAVKL